MDKKWKKWIDLLKCIRWNFDNTCEQFPSEDSVYFHGLRPTGERLRQLIGKFQKEFITFENDWKKWRA